MGMSYQEMRKCLDNAKKVVYKFTDPVIGTHWEMWVGAASAPHGPIDQVFNGPPDLWGTPGHVNGAPSHSGTHPDMSWNDIALLGDRTLAQEGNQQARAWGFKTIPEDGFIRDNNGNTGETGRFYCGIPDGCCNNRLVQIANQDVNTPAAERGIFNNLPVKKGDKIPYVLLMSDLSAFFGFDLEFSVDGIDYANLNNVCLDRGKWEQYEVPFCQSLQDGETLMGPLPCCAIPGLVA